MQTERNYLLNKCDCELITCQDFQAGGEPKKGGDQHLRITWLFEVLNLIPESSG